jgi:mono/diheme cytochrome c family protein
MRVRSVAASTGLIAALTFLLAVACSHSQQRLEEPVAESRFAVEEGGRLYQRYCSLCHGSEGRGDGAFFASNLTPFPTDFTTPEWAPSDEEIAAAIAEGSAARGQSDLCPAWGKTFSSVEIRYLVIYIRELKQQAGAVSSPRDFSETARQADALRKPDGEQLKK